MEYPHFQGNTSSKGPSSIAMLGVKKNIRTTLEVFAGRELKKPSPKIDGTWFRSKGGWDSHTNALQFFQVEWIQNDPSVQMCKIKRAKTLSVFKNKTQHVRSGPHHPPESVHIWQFVWIGTSRNWDIPLPCAAWKKQSTGELAALLALREPNLSSFQLHQHSRESKVPPPKATPPRNKALLRDY